MEQRAIPGFDGAEEELEARLLAGVNSVEIPEEEFWASVNQTTDAMLAEHKATAISEDSYRQSARNDVIRQFRYYLVTRAVPEIALRFREAVKGTVASLREHPLIGPRYPLRNPRLQNLRSWPVAGFDAVRIFCLPEPDTLGIIRILHQKRDVGASLKGPGDAELTTRPVEFP